MKGMAKAPGTCGELVQGTLNDINFLITCPINCYSQITVNLNNQDYIYINDPTRKKVLLAVNKTMQHILNRLCGAYINVYSQLPVSKGMASSTADIAAACLATAEALNYQLSPQEIAEIALSIEPSDGLFFPGIVAFDHVGGKIYKPIGNALTLDILIYDFGGEVDTIVFNQRPDLKAKNRQKENQIKKAMRLVEMGFQNNNPGLIAQGATISALANQSILSKPDLEDILELVMKKGALGINIAHSGTLMGILFERKKIDLNSLVHSLSDSYANLKYIGLYKLVNGGVKCIKEEEEWHKSESMVGT